MNPCARPPRRRKLLLAPLLVAFVVAVVVVAASPSLDPAPRALVGADAGAAAAAASCWCPGFPQKRRPNAGLPPTPRSSSSWKKLAFVVSTRGGGGESSSSDATTSSSSSDDDVDKPESRRDGSDDAKTTTVVVPEEEDDDERYSRQRYALGARAHRLIRSSTVYLDGPARSGLLYETAKNLALSGVGRIVVVLPIAESDDEARFHDARLDDLGNAYRRAARSELRPARAADPATESGEGGGEGELDANPTETLVGYLRRLNPSVSVSAARGRDQIRADGAAGRGVVVAVDRPRSAQVRLNRLARAAGMAYVGVETFGVYGRVFCDFGPTFQVDDPDGETPAVTPLLRVDLIEGDEGSRLLMVHSVDGEKHDVSKGDVVRFQRRDGRLMEGSDLIVSEVLGPFQFSASVLDGDGHRKSATDVIQECIDQEAVAFRRAKVPRVLSFEPLERAAARALTDPSLFTPSDLDKSFDDTRRRALFKSFQAISEFVNRYAQLPQSSGHIEAFVGLAAGPDEMGDTVFLDHCRRFAAACAAKFTPIQCVFGAVGAQEALKAISGLYTPTRQFLMYDTDEILPSDVSRTTEKQDSARHQSPGLRYILGDALVDALQKQRVFVVGAGAIGCELLKNLAAMGVATKSKGRIHLTDMDTIEKSNLSRQLLFRDSDIGAFKSSAAHKAALRFNPALRIESHSSKVGETGRSPFNAEFWSKKVDIVLNALDNVDARLFMDRQCVANKKALVDAGTMGPKGNVQVVVPDQSESYASSVDPPEPAVPVCTLKHFPYAIAHTIQWGRDLFDGLFTRRPAQANEFLEHVASSSLASYAKQMMNQKGEEAALQAAEELSEDFALISRTGDANDLEAARREALNWATRLAISLFFDSAVQLMKEHPMESLDEDGEPFWTGTRRPPKALMFASSDFSEHSTTNEHLIEFVRTAARLRLETLLPSLAGKAASSYTVDEAVTALETPQSAPELVPTNATVAKRIQLLLGGTKQTTPLTRYSPIEFEKDDDTNGHVAFVNAASNLRAIAYGIPPVEALETRRVAGNIVPAMVTTTAFVSGLSCVELVKLAQSVPLTLHRNAFINLALPFFAFTVPLPAERMPGLKGEAYTLWDRFDIREGKKSASTGGLTVRSLIRQLKKKVASDPESVEVSSIGCGSYMLYASFLHGDDSSVLDTPLWELIQDAVDADDIADAREDEKQEQTSVIDCSSFIDLAVVIEDLESGDEVELPPVRVTRYVPSAK